MRHISFNLFRAPSLSLALAFVAMSDIAAQSRVVLPAGSVVIVRTTTPLQSASAQNGQTFETTLKLKASSDPRAPKTIPIPSPQPPPETK